MSGLAFVGKQATQPAEIPNRGVTTTVLSSATPNQASVQSQLTALTTGAGATYASKSYVDTQDATFQLPSYYTTQDALNIPLTSVGVVSGAAALDSTIHVPAAQMPVLGSGMIQGPYGTTASTVGTTGSTPIKVADFNIGAISLSFQPLVFMQLFVTSTMGKPVVEVRIANSTTAPTYAGSTLVASGQGRSLYNDYHAVVVWPSSSTLGATYGNLGPTYNVWLSVWLYDALAQSVTISSGGVASGAAFLLRGAL